jgi:hypothetical protein
MKKLLSLLMLAFILISGPAFSQKRLSFGVTGTPMFTGMTNQNNYGLSDMDYKATFGMAGCANIGFDFNNHLGLVLQIGYSGLGQSYTDFIKDTTYARDIRLNYLQIPLMFKFRTGGSVARFYLMVGPQLNYLFSATQTYFKGDATTDDQVYNPFLQKWTKLGEETITDRYNSIDVMGRLDLGVEISLLKNLYLNGGLSLAYGFLDINASDWQIKDSSGNYNPSNNFFGGFHVGINYCFEL